MRRTFLLIVVIWLSFVGLMSCTRAGYVGDHNKFMADQIYSIYLERQNHIHEAAMMHVEYNPELDKSFGIQIDLLCQARGRNNKQCYMQMLYEVGGEFNGYRGF